MSASVLFLVWADMVLESERKYSKLERIMFCLLVDLWRLMVILWPAS